MLGICYMYIYTYYIVYVIYVCVLYITLFIMLCASSSKLYQKCTWCSVVQLCKTPLRRRIMQVDSLLYIIHLCENLFRDVTHLHGASSTNGCFFLVKVHWITLDL